MIKSKHTNWENVKNIENLNEEDITHELNHPKTTSLDIHRIGRLNYEPGETKVQAPINQ